MVTAHRVSRHEGVDTEAAKRPGLLEDPNVTSTVPEGRRRGDHPHAQWRLHGTGGPPPSGPARQPAEGPFAGGYASSGSRHGGRGGTARWAARVFLRTPFGDGRRAGALNSTLVV